MAAVARIRRTMFARGTRAFDGRAMFTGFTTVTPPNTPVCMTGSWGDRRQFNENGVHGLFPPSSNHPGGVNAVFGDGSGRFITDAVNAGTQSAAHAYPGGGASPYGVWGALGTTAGGESLSL